MTDGAFHMIFTKCMVRFSRFRFKINRSIWGWTDDSPSGGGNLTEKGNHMQARTRVTMLICIMGFTVNGCGGYSAGTNVPCTVSAMVLHSLNPRSVVVRGVEYDYIVPVYQSNDDEDEYRFCSAHLFDFRVGLDYTLYVLDAAPNDPRIQPSPIETRRLIWPGVTTIHVESVNDYPGEEIYHLGSIPVP